MPTGIYKRKSTEELFWKKVCKTSGCWNWIGGLSPKGYGGFRAKGKLFTAHRYSYLLSRGEIPKNLSILHHCDNRKCVKPDHLYAGTAMQNTLDMKMRGREVKPLGEKNGMSKLKPSEVIEIKKLLAKKKTMADIARTFGVAFGTISAIRNGITWKHIKL